MNTQNNNQHQLYGEPLFIEGTAGKKQVTGEPQFVTGEEKHAHQLTPLYADNDITSQRTKSHQTRQHYDDEQRTEHSHKPAPEHVHLTIHTNDPSKINLEELVHITPDGQIKVTPEEERSRRTERLQEPFFHEEKRHLQEPEYREERHHPQEPL